MVHSSRLPGVPEHEGGPRATAGQAARLGYLGRGPSVFLDWRRPTVDVIAARIFMRAVRRMRWPEIVRSTHGRGYLDSVRKQVNRRARELGIPLPRFPASVSPGRPERTDQ